MDSIDHAHDMFLQIGKIRNMGTGKYRFDRMIH